MTIKEISADELKDRLAKGETLNIIDVREDEEVAEGMIPEAVHIKMGIFLKNSMSSKRSSLIFLSADQASAAKMSASICRIKALMSPIWSAACSNGPETQSRKQNKRVRLLICTDKKFFIYHMSGNARSLLPATFKVLSIRILSITSAVCEYLSL